MNKCMGFTQNFVHSAHYQDCKIGVLTICLVLIGRNSQGKQKKNWHESTESVRNIPNY